MSFLSLWEKAKAAEHENTLLRAQLQERNQLVAVLEAENAALQARGNTYRNRALAMRQACCMERDRSVNYRSFIEALQAGSIRAKINRIKELEAERDETRALVREFMHGIPTTRNPGSPSNKALSLIRQWDAERKP